MCTYGSAAPWDSIPLAAFDPLFWAHHTMIDRIWSLWQQANPGVPASGTVSLTQGLKLSPGMNVGQTLDINGLGYIYAAFSELLRRPKGAVMATFVPEPESR